jgi:hypothetical protein
VQSRFILYVPVVPVSATGVAIAALALAHQVLKSSSVSKKDKKQIEASAKQLVELAQMSDIDKRRRKRANDPFDTGPSYEHLRKRLERLLA